MLLGTNSKTVYDNRLIKRFNLSPDDCSSFAVILPRKLSNFLWQYFQSLVVFSTTICLKRSWPQKTFHVHKIITKHKVVKKNAGNCRWINFVIIENVYQMNLDSKYYDKVKKQTEKAP